MASFFKAIINVLLLFVALGTFGLHTAECAAMSKDGSVSAARISDIACHCFEAKHCYAGSKAKPASTIPHHHKDSRKYSPGKSIVFLYHHIVTGTADPGSVLLSSTIPSGYRFLYSRSITPPPLKA